MPISSFRARLSRRQRMTAVRPCFDNAPTAFHAMTLNHALQRTRLPHLVAMFFLAIEMFCRVSYHFTRRVAELGRSARSFASSVVVGVADLSQFLFGHLRWDVGTSTEASALACQSGSVSFPVRFAPLIGHVLHRGTHPREFAAELRQFFHHFGRHGQAFIAQTELVERLVVSAAGASLSAVRVWFAASPTVARLLSRSFEALEVGEAGEFSVSPLLIR